MPDIVVSNRTQLLAALSNAKGGETIKLLSGDYGALSISNRNFAGMVTIVSADEKNPAVIRQVTVSGSSNVTFKNLDLVNPPGATEDRVQLNSVSGSRNIGFDGVHIRGSLADPQGSKAVGIGIKDSSGISIVNSTLDHMAEGFDIINTSDVTIRNNSFSELRRDGMILASVQRVVIDNNLMTDFHPGAGDHPDGIQFYTNGRAVGSSDITITNNVILQGKGGAAQGIFLSDEQGNLPYVNVTIRNNLVYMSGLANAITVGGGRNVVVTSNTALSRSDDATLARIYVRAISGGTVSNNVADTLEATGNTGVAIGDNAWLGKDGAAARALRNVNALAGAKISDLLIDRVGFHPAPGTAAYDLWTAEQAGAPPADHMILDLRFSPTGLQDRSHFNSSTTTAAINPANIRTVGGESRYHVATGKGFELARINSYQIFDMSAFTLSFDLQRDSASATTGQVMGIHQSWSVTLTSGGELNFTMRNDAGISYSVVTKDAKITDDKIHDIAITYDRAAQRAVIYVDNVARGTGTVTGSTRGLESWSLYVGNPYGTSFSGNIDDIQLRDVALPASQIQSAGGSGTAELPPVKTNPFRTTSSLATGSFASFIEYKRHGIELAHA